VNIQTTKMKSITEPM